LKLMQETLQEVSALISTFINWRTFSEVTTTFSDPVGRLKQGLLPSSIINTFSLKVNIWLNMQPDCTDLNTQCPIT